MMQTYLNLLSQSGKTGLSCQETMDGSHCTLDSSMVRSVDGVEVDVSLDVCTPQEM